MAASRIRALAAGGGAADCGGARKRRRIPRVCCSSTGSTRRSTYPRLTRIEFLDAARTRAAAHVTIGYSGVTVVLEQRGAAWVPVRLTNEWIT
jgi:hypothetical protein